MGRTGECHKRESRKQRKKKMKDGKDEIEMDEERDGGFEGWWKWS